MKKRAMWRGVVGVSLVAGAVAVVGAGPASAGRSGAAQVINLNTIPESTSLGWMLTVGSKIFFTSDDNVHGRELFVTDGTLAGTKMVKDINPDGNGVEGGENSTIANVNGTLYFTANDGIHGKELWKSDGTEAGTVMVKDINPGSSGSYPERSTNLNGTLLFTANDGTNGIELWKSDGLAAGTVMVKDIAPTYTTDYPVSVYTDFAVLGSTAYFGADDGTNGVELWKSDGTAAGTVMVQDMFPGSAGSYPDPKVAAGAVWFRISEPANSSNFHLWKYDGTTLTDVVTFPDGGIDNDFYALDGSKVLFRAFDRVAENGWELWVTDGTGGGTQLVKDINATDKYQGSDPGNFIKMGDKVYFTASDGVNGMALWVTNGTSIGTTMVKDVAANTTYYDPKIQYLTVVGDTLYFRANDDPNNNYDAPTPRGAVSSNDAATVYGEELWKSNGTTDGTVLVKDINTESEDRPRGSDIDAGNSAFQVLGTSLYFFADDGEVDGSGDFLWTSDGTAIGTVKFADISIVDRGSDTKLAGILGSKALFFAEDGDRGALYATDGTQGGTTRLVAASSSQNVVIVGTKAYFTGYDDTNGWGLWETDGTASGTKLVKDVAVGSLEDSFPGPYGLTAAGSQLYFFANDGTNGRELWTSDGTTPNTKMVEDINPGLPGQSFGGSDLDRLGVLGDKVYFKAEDGTNGSELWVSDGTAAGTSMLKDIDPGVNGPSEAPCYGVCSSEPTEITTVGSTLFFRAYTSATGSELWKTNGTEAGTVLVKDIRPGDDDCACPVDYPWGSQPFRLTEMGGKLYFTANDGSGGFQLWTSDGIEAGTTLVKSVAGGYLYSLMVVANGRLFFNLIDGSEEPWVSDGTEAGTVLLKDINPGPAGSSPSGFVATPTGVYFAADDPSGSGRSIWFSDGTEANTTVAVALNNDYGRPSIQPYRGGLLYGDDNGTDGTELWSYGLPVGTAQTISFTPPANMKANEVVELTGTATSGLPVTYLATGQCEIKTSGRDAGKLKLKGAGTCSVRAMQAGNEEWAPADDVLMTIAIARNNVVVKFLGVVKALSPTSFGVLSNASGRVQLKAQVTPALEGCEVRFDVSPNNATPAGPYTATSDEDGIILSEPIVIGQGTYDFTVTPLGDCEGTPVDAPEVYLGELPPTGANTTDFVWIGATLLAAGVLLVGRRRRTV